MERSSALSDVIELRIDSIRNVDLSKLISAKSVGAYRNTSIIITNRKRNEGGKFEGSEGERVTLLKEAIELGADFVDIELSTENALIEELLLTIRNHDNKTKLIVSHHDFNGSPTDKLLKDRFNECLKAGADIVKLITYANSMEDNLRVLNLISYAKRKDKEIIAFCMGNLGRISRVMAPILGSYLCFASLEKGDESAPGQMTASEMKQIFRILR